MHSDCHVQVDKRFYSVPFAYVGRNVRVRLTEKLIEVFDEESHLISDVKWLGQGTIYPDVIESVSVKGPSATIKSHHNVGGLPAKMKLTGMFRDESN